jgi:hypothetical protein
MAALITADRILVGAQFQSDVSQVREPFGAVTKIDIQAAVAAIDDWIVTNAAAFNNTLPTAAKTNLTAAQKANLFARVLKRRYETGA